jgi:hypothetical protein
MEKKKKRKKKDRKRKAKIPQKIGIELGQSKNA